MWSGEETLDYRRQFTGDADSGARASASILGAAAAPRRRAKAPKGAKRRKKGAGRAAPRNTWRVRNGRKVYFDENGKQSTGGVAYQKYNRKANQARAGA